MLSFSGLYLLGPVDTHGLSRKGILNSYLDSPCSSTSMGLIDTCSRRDDIGSSHETPPSRDLDIGIDYITDSPDGVPTVKSSTAT